MSGKNIYSCFVQDHNEIQYYHITISVVKCTLVKCSEVLHCNDGTSNKVSNIIKKHIDYHILSYLLGSFFINIWFYSCLIL
jgi:hypothetical protein